MPIQGALRAQDFEASTELAQKMTDAIRESNVGMLVSEARPIPWLARIGLQKSQQHRLLSSSPIPVFIPRKSKTFSKILVAIGKEEYSATIVSIAVDVARQFDASLCSLTVVHPHADQKEAQSIEELPKQIMQIGRANGIEIESIFENGNPIEKIRSTAQDFDLLIVGFSGNQKNNVFKPNISLHLLHNAPISTLFVPYSLARK